MSIGAWGFFFAVHVQEMYDMDKQGGGLDTLERNGDTSEDDLLGILFASSSNTSNFRLTPRTSTL